MIKDFEGHSLLELQCENENDSQSGEGWLYVEDHKLYGNFNFFTEAFRFIATRKGHYEEDSEREEYIDLDHYDDEDLIVDEEEDYEDLMSEEENLSDFIASDSE
mgnify:CR=1 FL=1